MNRVLAPVLAHFLAALALLLPGGAAVAQSGARVVMTTSWVEEWDPAAQQWVQVEENAAAIAPAADETTTRFEQSGNLTITETVRTAPSRLVARPASALPQLGEQFGPFRVLDDKRAALVATTDAASPQAFAAMLAAHPGLAVIEFADAPGTNHDLANLQLGRMIRAAGLATHVPEGGSARSGAVELFLAGTHRTMDPRALFAVHSWRDTRGREPDDFAADAPENRLYLDYYAEMGMSADQARAFYAMTNSVPHTGALWIEGADMARWVAPLEKAPQAQGARRFAQAHGTAHDRAAAAVSVAARPALPRLPRLAYGDVGLPMLALLDSRAAFP